MGVTGREVRIVDGAYTGDPDAPVGPPVLDAWVRFAELPDDPAAARRPAGPVHRAPLDRRRPPPPRRHRPGRRPPHAVDGDQRHRPVGPRRGPRRPLDALPPPLDLRRRRHDPRRVPGLRRAGRPARLLHRRRHGPPVRRTRPTRPTSGRHCEPEHRPGAARPGSGRTLLGAAPRRRRLRGALRPPGARRARRPGGARQRARRPRPPPRGAPPTYAFPTDDVHGAPTEPEPEAPGHVRVPWDAADAWFEEERGGPRPPPEPVPPHRHPPQQSASAGRGRRHGPGRHHRDPRPLRDLAGPPPLRPPRTAVAMDHLLAAARPPPTARTRARRRTGPPSSATSPSRTWPGATRTPCPRPSPSGGCSASTPTGPTSPDRAADTCPLNRLTDPGDPVRPLPQLTPVNEWFWTSGADGRLRIQQCDDCRAMVHPPTPICPACRSRAWTPAEVSGVGTVVGFTVNQHQWHPDFEPPYAIANVALAEDPTVHLTTNVVGCEPDEVHIGQEVRVRFEACEDVWLPLFEPTGQDDPTDPVPEPERPDAPGPRVRRPLRAPGRPVRRRAVRHRAAPDAGPAVPGRGRLPGGGRGRRPHPRGHRRPVDLSRRRPDGDERGRGDRRRGGPAPAARPGSTAAGTSPGRAGRSSPPCWRWRRAVPPRPLLPHGVGVDLRHPRPPRRGWRRRVG